MRNWILVASAVLALSACSVQSVWSPDDVVKMAEYRHNGPTRLTLFTMISNGSGAGRHSSLMINGSQRVIFDPAGTFQHEQVPEQNDVIFGITPSVADGYTRYHARETFHVQVQQIDVSAEVAELAIRRVKAYGLVPAGKCSLSTSSVISGLPGFEQIQQTWYPSKLSEQFSELPGVTSRTLYEYDSDDNSKVLEAWDPKAAYP